MITTPTPPPTPPVCDGSNLAGLLSSMCRDGGDYIRPLGSSYWLALCGRSSGCGQWKMVHIEKAGKENNVGKTTDEAASTAQGPVNSDRAQLRLDDAETKREKLAEERAQRKLHAEHKQALKAQKRRETNAPSDADWADGLSVAGEHSHALKSDNAETSRVVPVEDSPEMRSMTAKERRLALREAIRRKHGAEKGAATDAGSDGEVDEPEMEPQIAKVSSCQKHGWAVSSLARVHDGWEEVGAAGAGGGGGVEAGAAGDGADVPVGASWTSAARVSDLTRAALKDRQSHDNEGGVKLTRAKKEEKGSSDAQLVTSLASAMFKKNDVARFDAYLLVDYQVRFLPFSFFWRIV